MIVEQFPYGLSRENLSSGFLTKRVSNQSPQLQRLARLTIIWWFVAIRRYSCTKLAMNHHIMGVHIAIRRCSFGFIIKLFVSCK